MYRVEFSCGWNCVICQWNGRFCDAVRHEVISNYSYTTAVLARMNEPTDRSNTPIDMQWKYLNKITAKSATDWLTGWYIKRRVIGAIYLFNATLTVLTLILHYVRSAVISNQTSASFWHLNFAFPYFKFNNVHSAAKQCKEKVKKMTIVSPR